MRRRHWASLTVRKIKSVSCHGKINFKIVFTSALFICEYFCSAVIKTATNTAENINVNIKVGEKASSAGSSNEDTTNTVAVNENGNTTAEVQTSATPDKEQRQKTIDKYIAGVAKVSDAEEYKEARKILYGDLDGDGDEDAAAQFTIEGMGGGNMYNFYLAVFKNENGKFTAVTDEPIGGKLNRDVEFTKIENGKMFFDTKGYGKDDGACCPSIAGKTSFVLEGNKIVEVKAKNENKK